MSLQPLAFHLVMKRRCYEYTNTKPPSKQSKAIDLSAKTRFEDLNLASITNLALNCDERLLPILANAYDVSIDGLETKEARKLISKALL